METTVVRDALPLKILINAGVFSYRDTPTKLQSGRFSQFYVSGRDELTEDPAVAIAMANIMFAKVIHGLTKPADGQTQKKVCFIGLPVVGTGIAAALSWTNVLMRQRVEKGGGIVINQDFGYLIMREKKKEHGKEGQKWVNGSPKADTIYVVVDNALTSGDTLIESAKRFEEDGFDVTQMLPVTFVNRGGQNAINRVKSTTKFPHVWTALSLHDVVENAERYEWWPEGSLAKFQKEQREADIQE